MAPQRPRPRPARCRNQGARHPPDSRLDRLRLRRTKADAAYEPDEPVDPQSVYGASKAAGEFAVRTAQPRHAILRTAWVVSPHRGNFVKTMLRLAGERDGLSVVDDQIGCPTSAADLAAALATVALRMAADPQAPTGTFHCVNGGATSWCGFARAIVEGAARRGGRSVPVTGIPTSAYPTPARRPANSRLSTESLTAAYGIVPRPWQEALDDILDRSSARYMPELYKEGHQSR